MACNPASPQLRPAADVARAGSVTSRDHCPAAAAPAVGARSMLPSCSSARAGPDGAAAMASGTSARRASSRPGVQFRPVSVLAASGEKARSWLGRNPTSSEPPVPAATRPPLSATPAGVTSDHVLAPAGRTKSCQKLFFDAAAPSITAIAQVPCAVTSAVLSGAVTAAGVVTAILACCVPQPASRLAQYRLAHPRRARPAQARLAVTRTPAPAGRTG